MTTPQLPDPPAFYAVVWDIVRQIPTSQVATYGQIAAMIPAPPGIDPGDYDKLGPRWVGDAMNAISAVSGVDDPTIPWHRVINSKGGISMIKDSRPAQLQRQRLEAEGITFNSKEVVDFAVCGWDGPDTAWIDAHGLKPARSLKPPPADGPQQLSLF